MSSPRFVPGQLYRRRDLHAEYGDSHQSGISFSTQAPVVFLFTGEQYGYHDGWQGDGTYLYTGEGQVGDMMFARGNLAIRDHAIHGCALYLFTRVKQPSGHVSFVSQMAYADHRLIDGVPDRDGTSRTAIVFELRPVSPIDEAETIPVPERYDDQLPPVDPVDPVDPVEQQLSAFDQSRLVAEDAPAYHGAPVQPSTPGDTESGTSRTTRTFVLRRAQGHCEGCGLAAPFLRIDGSPYLEPHRVDLGSDQDLPAPESVVALCPNCHRRAHFGEDGRLYNEQLTARLAAMPR